MTKDSYFDIAGNLGSGSSTPLELDINTRQLTIVVAHINNNVIKVEYNGIVVVTGSPKLYVRDNAGNKYTYTCSREDSRPDEFVSGQTLLLIDLPLTT